MTEVDPKTRDLLTRLRQDGWFVARKGPGDHVQYKHPTKPGRVTIDTRDGANKPLGRCAASIAKRDGTGDAYRLHVILRRPPVTRLVMLIHGEPGNYGASFPDFPGATTGADDLDALYRKAAEMLAFHVAGLVEDGEPETAVRSLDELQGDPVFRADSTDAMIGLVDVDLPGKAVRVNISVEESLLRRIDRAAEAAGESRSGFLAQAARTRLAATAR